MSFILCCNLCAISSSKLLFIRVFETPWVKRANVGSIMEIQDKAGIKIGAQSDIQRTGTVLEKTNRSILCCQLVENSFGEQGSGVSGLWERL